MASYFSTNIDFKLLREQKRTLLKLYERQGRGITPTEGDAIMGIVHLIDHVQDWAHEREGVHTETVYGKKFGRLT